jgi:putative addiction module killer protein
MKKWIIGYWRDTTGKNSVEKWLDSLNEEQLKFIAKELKLLEISGNQLRLPHSKSLGKGLFELRERRYGYRIYYGFYKKQIIMLLVAGDKATQKKDIKIAYTRLKKLMG